jgi:hypothetical protein
MKGIKVKKGSARDAKFILSDPGHVKHDKKGTKTKQEDQRMAHLSLWPFQFKIPDLYYHLKDISNKNIA